MKALAASLPADDQLLAMTQALAASRALLGRVLPSTVIDRLLAAPDAPIADRVEDATVLFADIEGFVAIARRLGPERSMALLDRLTRAFDEAAERHGVEKIKTIGDGYMAVAGVLESMPDHCERMALFALDMAASAARVSEELEVTIRLRIGLARGPVMAGVIGTAKFTFDVWGDTVNLASRLERRASAGTILVSGLLAKRLGSSFALRPCGSLELKGLGPDDVFALIAPGRLH